MNVLYICRVSEYQASGNQIDIPKKVAMEFFNVPESYILESLNFSLNICHVNDLRAFEMIEIQPATNLRFSTRLNTFLSINGDKLSEGDLLVFEKIMRSYSVRCIKRDNSKYNSLVELFDEGEKHMLLSASMNKQPEDTEKISANFRPYITAIKSKPFLLLAGISGTGKSRIVRELARACWDEGSEEYKAQKPKNFEMVQVKPNWHDSSELIGYVSRVSGEPVYVAGDFLKFVAKAWENLEVPHFLCLDEMNLAPVEQYFAEYLSVVESRKCQEDGTVTTDPILKPEYEKERDEKTRNLVPKKWYSTLVSELLAECPLETIYALKMQFEQEGITIPQNLIVVGTVNMDETTFSFSRKVLDRAMTIEMNEVDLEGGLDSRYEKIGKLEFGNLIGTAVEGVDVYADNKEVCDKVIKYLKAINEKLEGTPFKVAYRTRNEFLLYVVNNLPYNKDKDGNELEQNFVIARALDEITSMKILSRIEGDETKVSKDFLNDLRDTIKRELNNISQKEYSGTKDKEGTEYAVSLAKLKEMIARLESGYTSFWS